MSDTKGTGLVPAGRAVPSCLQKAATLLLVESLPLACQGAWRLRARLSEADVLMRGRARKI